MTSAIILTSPSFTVAISFCATGPSVFTITMLEMMPVTLPFVFISVSLFLSVYMSGSVPDAVRPSTSLPSISRPRCGSSAAHRWMIFTLTR